MTQWQENITKEVERIRASAGDCEIAHGMEDDLYLRVLRAIADGSIPSDEVSACAALAIQAADIDFARWCA